MDISELLKSGAAELGVPLDRAQVEALAAYMAELSKWNAVVNLTAIERPDEVVVKHFLDSLSLCPFLPEGPLRAADIGAGAGFPGIPVKIARPDMGLVLVEPAKKKATFLRRVVMMLGLRGVEVAEERVERLTGGLAGPYDVVMSRAYKEPAGLMRLAAPLMSEGGSVVLSLGPGSQSTPPAGWTLARLEEITLPHSSYRRRIAVYRPS